MFNDRIPYNSTILAQVTRHSVGDVERAVQMLKDLELIEVLDNGAIYITDIQNFIGESSTEADRKRAYRNRIETEKALSLENNSGQMSDKGPDKNPPELELELEIEKEKELENKEQKLSSAELTDKFESLWKLYPNKKGKPSALKSYKKAIKNGVTDELIKQGIENYNEYLAKNTWLKPAHGSTWFNQERWTDEYDDQVRSGGYDTSEYDDFF